MKTYTACYPCFLRHALEATRFAGGNESDEYRVLKAVLQELVKFDARSSPPEMAYLIQKTIKKTLGNWDPYREVKDQSTKEALSLYPTLKTMVMAASNPLAYAISLSIAGNIIDFGFSSEYDLYSNIEMVLTQGLPREVVDTFQRDLERARDILFLGDNAGETVFDRVLIENLSRPITYVVKGGPVLNDATMSDAVDAGLDRVAEVIDNGSDAPGTLLPLCSPAFRERFCQADLVIAKGQSNYETLSNERAPIYFLLQAKCPVIAREIGVPEGTAVMRRSMNYV